MIMNKARITETRRGLLAVVLIYGFLAL